MNKISTAALTSVISFALVACQSETPPVTTAVTDTHAVVEDTTEGRSASGQQVFGKPGAPVEISYEVIGSPIVGVPVAINVLVTSPSGPLQVHYSINDSSALLFQDGQVERLEIVDPSAGSLQQLTVVPQREGRLYVNVSAEVQAPMGTMIRSIAIPIKVGRAPSELPVNGELKQDADGEKIVSMPATQPN